MYLRITSCLHLPSAEMTGVVPMPDCSYKVTKVQGWGRAGGDRAMGGNRKARWQTAEPGVETGCGSPAQSRGASRVLRVPFLSVRWSYRNCGHIRSLRASLTPRRTEVSHQGHSCTEQMDLIPSKALLCEEVQLHCLCSVRSATPGKSFNSQGLSLLLRDFKGHANIFSLTLHPQPGL